MALTLAISAASGLPPKTVKARYAQSVPVVVCPGDPVKKMGVSTRRERDTVFFVTNRNAAGQSFADSIGRESYGFATVDFVEPTAPGGFFSGMEDPLSWQVSSLHVLDTATFRS